MADNNQVEQPKQTAATEKISEDTLKYLREKRVPELMEYLLRNLIQEQPAKPSEFIRDIVSNPLPPHIIIAGPPASGKSTVCHHICAFLRKKTGKKPVHISSGDLLRDEVARGTNLGKIAEGYMNDGLLVPDSLIVSMIRERVLQEDAAKNGWLLDGFPRNHDQAMALDAEGFAPDLFFVMDIPDDVLIERVEGRRSDPVTGIIYHLKFNPPPQDDFVLLDRLEHRPDDTREVLGPRLETFHATVERVLEHYAPVTIHLDANRPEREICDDVEPILESILGC